MKKILCDRKDCIHCDDLDAIKDSLTITVCKRCDKVSIRTWDDSCDGYENADEYIKRISE